MVDVKETRWQAMKLAEGKPAMGEPSVHHLLRNRWSPRIFSDRPVESEKLRTVFEAARWAPSSLNEQPWSFIVATKEDKASYERLLSTLSGRNIQWARGVPVLVLSVAKLNFDRSGRMNRHAFHDVGQAVANLTVQANALDLFVHQMAGFDIEKTRTLFGIPNGYEPVAVIALGYLPESEGGSQAPPSGRSRRSVGSFVFGRRWGDPLPIVID